MRRLLFPSASVFHNMIRMRNIHEDAVFFGVKKRKRKFLFHFASLKVEQVLEVHPPSFIHCHDGPHAYCKSSHAISPLDY